MTVTRVGTDQRSEVAFSGGRAGSGPATWGQQAIWDVVRNLGTDAARYNVSGGMPLPAAVPAERVEAAVRDLVLLHESLRTRLRTADDGRLDQVVHAAGGIPVLTRQASPDTVTECAFALRDELLAVPFDAEREWPLRVGVVAVGGDARYVVFFMSHTASDGWGLRNLLADFAALLRGPLPARELLQPLEEAAFQTSERGRRRDAAARRSWLSKLRSGPASMFPARAGTPPAATFPNAVLHSPALGLALDRVAAELSVTPASVVLAAAAASAARITGVDEAVFQVVVNNRFLPGMAEGVNTIAQEGLFHLTGTAGVPFADLVRRTFGATLSAQRHAYYDKLALDRDIADLDGPCDHSCFVNDQRGLMSAFFAPPTPAPLREALTRTSLTWPVEHEPRRGVSFALDVQDAPGALELAMTADSALLPRTDMAAFLYGVEDLVVTEALDR